MKKQIVDIVISTTISFLEQVNIEFDGSLDETFVIYSNNSALDSLLSIQLILEIEKAIVKVFKKKVNLFEESLFFSERSPYRSIDELSDHILNYLKPKR